MKTASRDLSYSKLRFLQENSVSLKLLRSDHFALSASFIFMSFRKRNRENVPELTLRAELTNYVEFLKEGDEKKYDQSSKYYLDSWISNGLLRRFYVAGQEDNSIEPTYEVEKTFDFLISLEQQGFVGTESRLALILETLKKLAIETDLNPEARLKELEKKKLEIELEIEAIKKNGTPDTLSETQVKEYFSLFMEELSKLPTDFRKVTDNFREITKTINLNLIEEQKTKSLLLSDAHNANTGLEESDQGRSFNGFMNFLRSDDARVTADEHLKKVITLPVVETILKENYGYTKANIVKVWTGLYSPAQRVLEAKTQFGEQIRRVISSQKDIQEKGILNLLSEIKTHFLKNKGPTRLHDTFFSINKGLEVYMPLERTLWSGKKNELFNNQPQISENVGPTDEQLGLIFARAPIDLEQLKSNIYFALERRTHVTLAEVIRLNPIKSGLRELIAYLGLAHQGTGIELTFTEREQCTVSLSRDDGSPEERIIHLPKITFTEDSSWSTYE